MSKLETFLANWMSQYRHPKPNFRSTVEITKTPRALSQTRPSLLPDLSLKNRAKPFKDGRFLTSNRSLKREREFRSSARFSWFSMLNLRFPSNLGNGIENKLGCNIWCQRGGILPLYQTKITLFVSWVNSRCWKFIYELQTMNYWTYAYVHDFRPYQSKSIRIEIHTMNFKYDILYKEKVLSTLKRNIIHTRLSTG